MLAGRITVLAYILAFLAVPLVGIAIIGRPDYTIYHFSGANPLGVAVIIMFLVACFTPLFALGGGPATERAASRWAYGWLRRWVAPVAAILLVAFVLLYPADQARYRYFDTGIAGLGIGFFLAIAIKTVCAALLVWLMAEYVREPETAPWTHRLAVLILAGTLVYGASGTGDMFAASFFVLLFVSPRWFVRFLTVDAGTNIAAPRNWYKLFGIVVIAVQAFVSLNIGENIKEGAGTVGQSIVASVDQAFEAIDTMASVETPTETPKAQPKPAVSVASTGSWFVVRILEGIASHYYSTMQFFDGWAEEKLSGYAYPLSYVLNTVKYRMDVLLGSASSERPYIQSISRLNFLVLSLYPNDTEGTSPGAIAASAYLFPLPIALVAALAYLVLVSALINRMFHSDQRRISIVGGLVIMIQLQVLFQSPPDFLLLIDNGAVFFVTFLVLSLFTVPRASNSGSAP